MAKKSDSQERIKCLAVSPACHSNPFGLPLSGADRALFPIGRFGGWRISPFSAMLDAITLVTPAAHL